MPEYVSQAEFEAMLAAEEESPTVAVPVFVAPKVTDRGFYARRERALDFSRQQMAAAARVAALETRVRTDAPDAALVDELDAALAEQRQVLAAQVAFVLPFVRAIKYTDSEPPRLWVRPAEGPERESFDGVALTLLEQCSQAEFEAMLQAAQGVAQAKVPPTNGGR